MGALDLFAEFLEKEYKVSLEKQGPPGPPPRPGLQWAVETHRWVRPGNKPAGVGVGSLTRARAHQVYQDFLLDLKDAHGKWIKGIHMSPSEALTEVREYNHEHKRGLNEQEIQEVANKLVARFPAAN